MVSYVINNTPGKSIAPATRQRILDAITKTGYKPNKAAQALHYGVTAFAAKNIGLVVNNSDAFLRPYYTEIIAGIHQKAYEAGYTLGFIRFFDDLKNPVLFNSLVHSDEIGSIILLATDGIIQTDEDKAIIEQVKRRGVQVVCIEWASRGVVSVGFDRFEAGKLAAQCLVERGYRNVAYVGEMDDRLEGFMSVMLSTSGITKPRVEGALDAHGGVCAMERLSDDGRGLPRAVCVGSDEVAIGVLHCLNSHNVEVPSRVAVVSIDNIEMAQYTNPPLTTVNVCKREMGEKAVELIVNGEATVNMDEGRGDAREVLLPLNVVERLSI